jgi:hypothetical protein
MVKDVGGFIMIPSPVKGEESYRGEGRGSVY